MSYFFYLVNLNLVRRPIWISNCKKILSSELLNMDKAYDFVIKPLKNDPSENMVSILIQIFRLLLLFMCCSVDDCFCVADLCNIK